MLNSQDIENRFGFHKATIEGAEATKPKHEQLRMDYKSFANMLNEVLPEGREKSLVMTALEEASMWSHKSIAQSAPLEETWTVGDHIKKNPFFSDIVLRLYDEGLNPFKIAEVHSVDLSVVNEILKQNGKF